jgi:hypothetical protein
MTAPNEKLSITFRILPFPEAIKSSHACGQPATTCKRAQARAVGLTCPSIHCDRVVVQASLASRVAATRCPASAANDSQPEQQTSAWLLPQMDSLLKLFKTSIEISDSPLRRNNTEAPLTPCPEQLNLPSDVTDARHSNALEMQGGLRFKRIKTSPAKERQKAPMGQSATPTNTFAHGLPDSTSQTAHDSNRFFLWGCVHP